MNQFSEEAHCNSIFFCMYGSENISEEEKLESQTYVERELFSRFLSTHKARNGNRKIPSFIFEPEELSGLAKSAMFFMNTQNQVENIRSIARVIRMATQKGQPVCWLPCRSEGVIRI